jgi:hypothetical protein
MYSQYRFVCRRNLYKLISSLFADNIQTRIYLHKILRFCMVTSYKLVYFCLSTIRIPPDKLAHHVTVRIHSSSTHAKEESRDEEQDDGEEEDVVPDEVSGGLIQWDRVELSSSSILATKYHPQVRLISKFCLPCFSLFVLPLTLLRFPFQFF